MTNPETSSLVKRLEWQWYERSNGEYAETIFGRYSVGPNGWACDGVLQQATDSMDAAKAAAWRVYEAAVRAALNPEAATTIERLTAERDEGRGYVFVNPDSGTEYAESHPIESGEAHDAENIRRSTNFEDFLIEQLREAQSREVAAESLNARQAEALKPFSDFAGELFARNWNASEVYCALDNPDDPHRLTAGDFFHARLALTKGPSNG